MSRRKMRKRTDSKVFARTANRTAKVNLGTTARGGIRL